MRLIMISCALLLATSAMCVRAQDTTASPGPPPVPSSTPAETQPLPARADSPDASPTTKVVKPPVESKLLPADDGKSDPTWVAFRGWLLATLNRGDQRALLTVVDHNILNALDTPRGIVAFRKHWQLDSKNDRLLRDLSAALFLGSAWYSPTKGPKLLCAPYLPIMWPLHDVDPYDSGAIIAKSVLMKSAPSHASTTLNVLSYDIIEVKDWELANADTQGKQRWVKVHYREHDGYVPAEQIRSAIEPRACFAKQGGAWRMVEYVLGIEYLGGD
jgi:hypothetical protein